MADRIQYSNHSNYRLLQSSDAGIETALQQPSYNQEKSSLNYWSYYTDLNIPLWKRALGGVLLPVMGPLTLFGVGCEDETRSKLPVEGSGLVPDGGVPNDGSLVAIENHPPVWDSIADQQLIEGASFSLQLSAGDPDGDSLTYFPDALPRGAGLTAEGRFNWTPDFDQAGNYEVGVRVSDGETSVPESFKVVVENRNRPPMMQPILPKTGEEGTPLGFQVYASDPDGDQLQFRAENLPGGAVLGPSTGLFEWIPNYEQAGEYDVIAKVSDGTNTTAQQVEIRVRETNRPPIFEQPLSLQIISEGEQFSFTVVASDPDHDRVALSVDPQTLPQNANFDPESGDFRWAPGYDDGGKIYKVKFFASDGSATSEHNVSIRVENTNRPPEIIVPPEDQRIAEGQTLSFPVVISDPDEGDVIDVDTQFPSGAFIRENTGEFEWMPDYDQATEVAYEAVFEATDNHLASTIRSVRIFVEKTNRPPSVVVPDRDFIVAEGDRLIFAVTGSDPDEEEVGVSIPPERPLPDGARFENGVFDWTPDYNQSRADAYGVVFRATDAEGVTADERIEITVQNINRSPVVDPIENQEVAEGATLDFQISANDPDNDPITFIPEELPPGAELTPAGRFGWTPNFDQAQNNYRVDLRVSDGQIEVPASFNIDVENTNRPPTIDSIEAQRVMEGGYLSFFVTADDPDAEEVSVRAVSLPSGAIFHEATGEFEWTPDYDQAGEYQAVFEVTDGYDTVSQTVQITVENTNRPPTIIPLPDMTVTEGAQLVFAVGANDPDGGDITLTAPVLPEVATFENGIFNWTPSYEQAGEYNVVFRATDLEGAMDDEDSTISVENTNRTPVFNPIEDQVIAEGQELTFHVSAMDLDGQAVILGFNNRLPDGADFNAGTGDFSWTPSFNQAGNYAIEFTARDIERATATQIVRLIVENANRAPVFDPIDDRVVNEGESLSFPVNAISPDGLGVQIGVANLPRGAHFDSETAVFSWTPNYDQAGEYELEFIATDRETTTIEPVSIVVQNVNRPPVFDLIPEQNVLCGDIVRFDVTAHEPDGDEVELGVFELPDGAHFQNGSFEWVPGVGNQGWHQVVFWARSGDLQTNYEVDINVQTVERVSISSDGVMGDSWSFNPVVSGEGRFVGFESYATNLVPGDLNERLDIFVRDRQMKVVENLTLSLEERRPDDEVELKDINVNGRYVSFILLKDSENEGLLDHIFVFDRERMVADLIAIEEASGSNRFVKLSDDARFVAYDGKAVYREPGRIVHTGGVYVFDRETRITELVSVNSNGDFPEDGYSRMASINVDGRFVGFTSDSANLVGGDTNGEDDVFIRDRETDITERVSVNSDGWEGNSLSYGSSISAEGRFVTFTSRASNLVPGDENGEDDVFVRDRIAGITERVSVGSDGEEADKGGYVSEISADGRFVLFSSTATNLVDGEREQFFNDYVHDRHTRITKMVNVNSNGEGSNSESALSSLSPDGRFVVFYSAATNLVPHDINNSTDIFVASLACFFDLENE